MSVPRTPAPLRRGWGRYRLRTLFLVIGFVGITLGWMRREAEFRKLHAQLESTQPLVKLAKGHLQAHYRARLRIQEPGDSNSGQACTISSKSLLFYSDKSPTLGHGRSEGDTPIFYVESTFLVSLVDDSAAEQFSDYYQLSIFLGREPESEDSQPDHVILVRY